MLDWQIVSFFETHRDHRPCLDIEPLNTNPEKLVKMIRTFILKVTRCSLPIHRFWKIVVYKFWVLEGTAHDYGNSLWISWRHHGPSRQTNLIDILYTADRSGSSRTKLSRGNSPRNMHYTISSNMHQWQWPEKSVQARIRDLLKYASMTMTRKIGGS